MAHGHGARIYEERRYGAPILNAHGHRTRIHAAHGHGASTARPYGWVGLHS